MKYLDFNLYEKLCLPNYDIQDEKKWNRDYNKWLKEFEKIKPTLSKDFLNEFEKKHFHDYKVINIEILCNYEKNHYDLRLDLRDSDVSHSLIFFDISCLEMDFKNLKPFNMEWLVCEISKSKRNSKHIGILLADGKISFTFSNLEYKKIAETGDGSLCSFW